VVTEGPLLKWTDVSELLGSRILFVTIDELLARLRTTSFAEVVRELRNRRVYGVEQ